jgi:hypothetical protein
MIIEIKQTAMDTLQNIADWVEQNNTPGSGGRFLDKLFEFLQSYAPSSGKQAKCKLPEFKALDLHCLHYKDWVISYKTVSNRMVIYSVVHGSWLNY